MFMITAAWAAKQWHLLLSAAIVCILPDPVYKQESEGLLIAGPCPSIKGITYSH
jgi:hypothetical protein